MNVYYNRIIYAILGSMLWYATFTYFVQDDLNLAEAIILLASFAFLAGMFLLREPEIQDPVVATIERSIENGIKSVQAEMNVLPVHPVPQKTPINPKMVYRWVDDMGNKHVQMEGA